ncbi:dihydrolipoyl dehydrogenase [candidate division WOR-1 bacterium RIFOXYA2_FULL_36_21]|uniref:Dihydrolipoyl dehydrogenase n=1 Tax=candidate division WOR-1 bacterium RIFOXYB2_FULL_36_35 TaxID=1802578 RepID=A0A1F4S0X7_UNCSA|nr:MAG: dihydrolipoyl dehydrogenase [candidate division WOR-1 bacterium RIFOXYA2_FULL_36_21]OGC14096.1 MAG: dihydrolipoyl dehydrogenase [candidate division WOR-1 bacterium RIFOXYB2_FULL_36_35]OGC16528.1 MAG: dihydrolipoyl dehydrogenase [candidate division WOR-1 bacterium RIFOXYA12_FULL_36_13]
MEKSYDIAILGGGPGGYIAAIRASQLGAKVCLIEKDKVGGTCLNYGCIPTKALLACTSLYDKTRKLDQFGISAENISIDFGKVIERKNKIIEKLVQGVEFLLKKNGINVIYGNGSVGAQDSVPRQIVTVNEQQISASKIILATGSSPICLPNIEFNGECFMSSNDLLSNSHVPEKLDIVGGGVIGLHFAFIFNSLGTNVTIYEALPEILPGIDDEAIALIKRILARRKITVKTGIKFTKELSCGKTLICVGRNPNLEPIKNLNFKTEGKSLWVNEKMETSIPGIYAIGDLVSKKMFAHVASEQGVVAAENAMGGNKTFNYDCIPYTIYTNPEIAGVGLTEKEAKEKSSNIKVGKFPFAALGIAQAMGDIEGFIKVVADENEKILGVHIIGPEANTIIGAAAIALKNRLTADQLANTIQAHPSFPEGLQEATLASLQKSLHSIN